MRHARKTNLVRLTAALLCLLASGAPSVLAQQAPEQPHRCACRGHQADPHGGCACCRRAAPAGAAGRLAWRGGVTAQPHGADEGARRGAACVEETCGAGHHVPMTPRDLDPSCPLVVPSIPFHPLERAARLVTSACGDVDPRRPETPPPRSSRA